MKTILTVLASGIDQAIAQAHEAVRELEGLFTYGNLGKKHEGDRHVILDALSLLDIEVQAKAADVSIDAERRVDLGTALLMVKKVVEHHSWGFLVGNDDAQRDANIALVERFEAARRTITVACYDLEAMMQG
jgi:hypothetical protein